jgi:hypothetical protein
MCRVLYDVKNQSVEEKRDIIVRPEENIAEGLLNQENTGVSLEKIEQQGITLKDAIVAVS